MKQNLEGKISREDTNDIIITQCCMCRKYRNIEGEYIRVNEALNHVYETSEHILISHTYCEPCKEREIELIMNYKV